jgi:hypothetical protein
MWLFEKLEISEIREKFGDRKCPAKQRKLFVSDSPLSNRSGNDSRDKSAPPGLSKI